MKRERAGLLWHAITVLALVAMFALAACGASSATSNPDALAHAIAEDLACPVCHGQSVADSSSQLAGQMRDVIHQKVAAGESRDAIERYFVDAYGDAILLNPPRHGFWLLIWLVPVAFVAVGLAAVSLVQWRWLSHPGLSGAVTSNDDDETGIYSRRLEEELRRREPSAPTHDR